MIPYSRQNISQQDIKAVVKVLKSDWLTQGPKVREFEQALARYAGARYAVAVSSGTAALHLAYLVVGIRAGDEVITTPNTFVATTNMLLMAGAKPVFCDIRLDTYNLDENKIEPLITKKTKAIVPVHFAGQSVEMNKIWQLARKYDLKVIEDAAHALGAKYYQKKIGRGKSDMVIFSFHPVKSITTGEGGAILTDNKDYYQKLTALRSHGIYKDQKGKNVMTQLGYNYRLSDIQSALGISQLKKINQFIKERQQVVRWYRKYLADLKQIILPQELKNLSSSWHLYVIRLNNEKIRDKLASYLKNHDIGVNFHYPVIYQQPYYRRLKMSFSPCPRAVDYAKTALTLPLHTLMSESDVMRISQLVQNFFHSLI